MVNERQIRSTAPFLLGVVIGATLVYAEKKYPRENIKTITPLPVYLNTLDKGLEFGAMRFMNVWSHHWHWQHRDYDPRMEEFGIPLKGARSGNSKDIPLQGVVAHLGGRKYGYVIRPKEQRYPYLIGFRNPDWRNIKLCTIKLDKPIMMLVGPDEGCIVYMFDQNLNLISGQLLSDLMSRFQLPRGMRVL